MCPHQTYTLEYQALSPVQHKDSQGPRFYKHNNLPCICGTWLHWEKECEWRNYTHHQFHREKTLYISFMWGNQLIWFNDLDEFCKHEVSITYVKYSGLQFWYCELYCKIDSLELWMHNWMIWSTSSDKWNLTGNFPFRPLAICFKWRAQWETVL